MFVASFESTIIFLDVFPDISRFSVIINPYIYIVLYIIESTFTLIISATLSSKGQVNKLLLRLVLLVFPAWNPLSYPVLSKSYLSFMD